jgi:hypothetical protein
MRRRKTVRKTAPHADHQLPGRGCVPIHINDRTAATERTRLVRGTRSHQARLPSIVFHPIYGAKEASLYQLQGFRVTIDWPQAVPDQGDPLWRRMAVIEASGPRGALDRRQSDDRRKGQGQ